MEEEIGRIPDGSGSTRCAPEAPSGLRPAGDDPLRKLIDKLRILACDEGCGFFRETLIAADELERLDRDYNELREAYDRQTAELNHFRDPAMRPSQRYWEARWRDTQAESDRQGAILQTIRAEFQNTVLYCDRCGHDHKMNEIDASHFLEEFYAQEAAQWDRGRSLETPQVVPPEGTGRRDRMGGNHHESSLYRPFKEERLGASAIADPALVPSGPEPQSVSAHAGDGPLRDPVERMIEEAAKHLAAPPLYGPPCPCTYCTESRARRVLQSLGLPLETLAALKEGRAFIGMRPEEFLAPQPVELPPAPETWKRRSHD